MIVEKFFGGIVLLLFLGILLTGCQRKVFSSHERALILQGKPYHKMRVLMNNIPADNKILRRRSTPIRSDDPLMALFIARLRITMEELGGVGIAAPQIGINKRIILVKYPQKGLGAKPVS